MNLLNSPSSLHRKALTLACELCIIIRPLLAGNRAHTLVSNDSHGRKSMLTNQIKEY